MKIGEEVREVHGMIFGASLDIHELIHAHHRLAEIREREVRGFGLRGALIRHRLLAEEIDGGREFVGGW
jgi:hypothetical protein